MAPPCVRLGIELALEHVGRFGARQSGAELIPILGTCLFVAACLVYDRLAHGRVHPAFLWGGILVTVTLPARFALGQTDAWLTVARWLTE